jgi:hypothetical protein
MSKRDAIISLSTTYVDYMVATHARKEAIWLHRLCSGIGFEQKSLKIDRDSGSLEKNPTYHSKMKHIYVQYHFMRYMVERKKVLLEKVDTLKNNVDSLTKSVNVVNLSWCKEAMGNVSLG